MKYKTNSADWIMHESNITHLPLDIDVPQKDIFSEWQTVMDRVTPHTKADGSPMDSRHTGWQSLELFAPPPGKTTVNSDRHGFISNDKHSWTDTANDCPITVQWWKDTFKEDNFIGRLYFSWLLPGGSIGAHRDGQHSSLHGANVAITNPAGCHFHNGRAGIIDFDSHPVNMMNVSDKHWVLNNSDEPRLHMIYNGKVPVEIIERSYKKYEIQNR